MKSLTHLFVVFAVSLLFTPLSPGWTQSQPRPGMKIDVFATVKPGQWVQVEGVPQKDFTVLATEVKFLTGDFQDDDWEVVGVVRGIRKDKKEFDILLLPIKATVATDFESKDPNSTFKSFADLKTGMFVEIEGTYLKDATFLAEEVQDETKNKADETGTVTFLGKAEKINPQKRTITVMGTTFVITDRTQAKSAVK